MISNFETLKSEAACRGPKKVAVILPHETASIEAINSARIEGMAEGILIGQSSLIESLLKKSNIPLTRFEIHDETDATRAAEYGVQLAASDAVDIILKGSVSTNILLGAVLRCPTLRTGNLLSDVFIFEHSREGRRSITLSSDGGVIVAPDLKAKLGIIRNAVTVAHALGINIPKVAILSGVEKVQPEVQSTIDAVALAKICSYGEIPDCLVDGPFALDNAISAEAAQIKKIESPVAGSADILIMPNLEAGNIFGKSLVYYGGKTLAHVIIGAKIPILISSRSDPPEPRLVSIALGILLSSLRRTPG
jgi:phosphate butyryltransferase